MIKQAVFLVGGLGSRLGARTATTPKPLLPVAGRPFLDYLVDRAARAGFTDICLLAGHHGDQVVDMYHDRRVGESAVRVLTEPERLGTGGALRWSLGELEDVFLLSNGDSLIDIDFRSFVESSPSADALIALIDNVAGDRYGRVQTNENRVEAFMAASSTTTGPINGGVYRFSRSIIEHLPEGVLSLENSVLPALAEQRLLHGVRYDRYFIDIGVPEDFARAQIELAGQ